MAKYQRCGPEVKKLADALMDAYWVAETVNREMKIDYLFAYGDVDETTGVVISPAIIKGGVRALGQCRITSLKDRAKGLGDAEILLDHDHWESVNENEQRALLDHELHHIVFTGQNDDLGRPKLKLRKHDYEFGWFRVIAERHGLASPEVQQAQVMILKDGQTFWPGIHPVSIDVTEAAVKNFRKA